MAERRLLTADDINILREKLQPQKLIIIGNDGAGYDVPPWMSMHERLEPPPLLMPNFHTFGMKMPNPSIVIDTIPLELGFSDLNDAIKAAKAALLEFGAISGMKKRARWRIVKRFKK
jgi:hypothetical protein